MDRVTGAVLGVLHGFTAACTTRHLALIRQAGEGSVMSCTAFRQYQGCLQAASPAEAYEGPESPMEIGKAWKPLLLMGIWEDEDIPWH